jgi:hypothetical protein
LRERKLSRLPRRLDFRLLRISSARNGVASTAGPPCAWDFPGMLPPGGGHVVVRNGSLPRVAGSPRHSLLIAPIRLRRSRMEDEGYISSGSRVDGGLLYIFSGTCCQGGGENWGVGRKDSPSPERVGAEQSLALVCKGSCEGRGCPSGRGAAGGKKGEDEGEGRGCWARWKGEA